MEKMNPRKERKSLPAEKKKPFLADIRSLTDREPRKPEKRSPLEGRKKKAPVDVRKIIILSLGIVLLALIVVVAATAGYNALRGNAIATPTPVPTAAPEPTPEATPEPTAAPEPSQVITPTPGPVISNDGPFSMHASLNKADGKCLITLQLLKHSAPVDISKVKIDMECEGSVFRDVWTPKLMDWCNADNDTMLEKEEIIATIIDTSAESIPQGKPLTIVVLMEGEKLQEVTVLPS